MERIYTINVVVEKLKKSESTSILMHLDKGARVVLKGRATGDVRFSFRYDVLAIGGAPVIPGMRDLTSTHMPTAVFKHDPTVTDEGVVVIQALNPMTSEAFYIPDGDYLFRVTVLKKDASVQLQINVQETD